MQIYILTFHVMALGSQKRGFQFPRPRYPSSELSCAEDKSANLYPTGKPKLHASGEDSEIISQNGLDSRPPPYP